MSDATRYAYPVARIRAIEKKLLDKLKLDRMIDAKAPEEAMKVLAEADYGDASTEMADAVGYEKLLEAETRKVYTLLKEIAPEPGVFNLFLLRHDYHNAKVVLKNEFLGREDKGSFIDLGTIPVNRLKTMIKERKMSEMPETMRKAIEECIDAFNRSGDPQTVDLILDRAAFQQMSELAVSTGKRFVQELVSIWTDLANINTFLRIRKMKKSWDFLQKALLPGGKIDAGIYIKHLQEPLESFINALQYTRYSSVCEEGIGSFATTGSLTRFEKLSDNFVLEYIKKARYIALGVEPLIGYLVAKEYEIKNARIIMTGKINNISGEIIRERLRETYV